MTALDLAHAIVDALEDRKGEDILLLDVRKIVSFTDYFVLCTATSDRMLKALAEATMEGARKQNAKKGRIEGKPEDGWLVVDYGDIVVHLFAADLRRYYRLEELWSDGKILLRLQ